MVEVGQRQPRVECPAFLAFVRRKPCCACGAPPRSQAAHVRIGCPAIGKRSTGMSEKPNDRWAVPLCADCHLDAPDSQHNVGERKFWARLGKDPFKIASDLYAQFERRLARSPEQREKVGKRATSVKRAKVRREKRKYNADETHLAKMARAGRLGEVEVEFLSLLMPRGQRKAKRIFREVANRWPKGRTIQRRK